MPRARLSTILSGVAGEYFAAAELSRRGYVASITLRNTRGIDILAANEAGTRTAQIQVKTNQDSNRDWVLSNKAESFVSDRLFYVFVALNGLDGHPSFHVVPSAIVAKQIATSHRAWLSGRRRDGARHKDTSIRKFKDRDGKYLDAWQLLGLD